MSGFVLKLAKIDLKRYYFLILKKGQDKAKWRNHFISRKLFQKGQMATLQPTYLIVLRKFNEMIRPEF